MYLCHFFLIFFASVCSIPFLVLYWAHLCLKYSLGISNFLKEISSLSHSIIFLYFFSLITEEGFLIFPCSFFGTLHLDGYISLFLLCFSRLFLSKLFVRLPQIAILPFCISFSWGWSWSLSPVQCHEPTSIVHQAFYLSDLVPWIYFSCPLYNCKGFHLGHTRKI